MQIQAKRTVWVVRVAGMDDLLDSLAHVYKRNKSITTMLKHVQQYDGAALESSSYV